MNLLATFGMVKPRTYQVAWRVIIRMNESEWHVWKQHNITWNVKIGKICVNNIMTSLQSQAKGPRQRVVGESWTTIISWEITKVFKSLMIALEKLLVEHFPELANKIMSYNNFVYDQIINYNLFYKGEIRNRVYEVTENKLYQLG